MFCVPDIPLEQEFGVPVFRMESERRVLFIQDGLDKSEQLHLVAKWVHRQFLAQVLR